MIRLFYPAVQGKFHNRSPDDRRTARRPALHANALRRSIDIAIVSRRLQPELQAHALVDDARANLVVVSHANAIHTERFQALPNGFVAIPTTERVQYISEIPVRTVAYAVDIDGTARRIALFVAVLCVRFFERGNRDMESERHFRFGRFGFERADTVRIPRDLVFPKPRAVLGMSVRK